MLECISWNDTGAEIIVIVSAQGLAVTFDYQEGVGGFGSGLRYGVNSVNGTERLRYTVFRLVYIYMAEYWNNWFLTF